MHCLRMARVHQHEVRLREDRRADRCEEAAALVEPAREPPADRIVVVHVADALGRRVGLGPAEDVVVRRVRGICRQVAQRHQHRQPRLRGEVDDRRSPRGVPATVSRRARAVERRVARPGEPPEPHPVTITGAERVGYGINAIVRFAVSPLSSVAVTASV